jgi:carboxypeptidase PM20D1
LDEGLFVIDGVVPAHPAPVAMICVAEKGSVSVELTVQMDAGHSSAPPASTAIGVLASAVSKLEKNPHPAYFNGGPTGVMFGSLATGFKPLMRVIMSNLWLTAPLVKRLMISKPATATALRTTTALTVFKSGTKVNVLPLRAQAYVNHRIHPLDDIATVVERDRRIINDKRVKLTPVDSSIEPSPVSDHRSPSFRALHETVTRLFPLFLHYWVQCSGLLLDVYRFMKSSLMQQ